MAIELGGIEMTEDKKLSGSAQLVQDYLSQKGLSCNVSELSSSTRTAKEAATSLGCDVAQIVKSLLFCTAKTKEPVLVLASGVNRVDEKILEKLVGDKIMKAEADFTREITGFAIGGVPPVAHKNLISTVFIDEDLMRFDILWAAAGTPRAVFSLSPLDLKALSHGVVIKLKV